MKKCYFPKWKCLRSMVETNKEEVVPTRSATVADVRTAVQGIAVIACPTVAMEIKTTVRLVRPVLLAHLAHPVMESEC